MYYRCTNSDSPMSDWGHAMFADSLERVDHYGKNVFVFDGQGAVNIYDLEDKIRQAWAKSQESGDFGEMYDEYYQSLSADEVFESFAPADIVNSAEGYDCDLVVWLYQMVLEPNGIYAVITPDGAVVFDETLINRLDPDEIDDHYGL